ncbi:MAG: hypothetical protein D6701_02110, partial [Gemmatimonadetes bacterium]
LTAAATAAPVQAQSWRTVTMARQLSTEGALEVDVFYGAGRFRVGPAEAGTLYRAQLRYDEDSFEPVAELDGDHLRLGTESLGRRTRIRSDDRSGELDVRLSPDIPLDLNLDFGAVRADIDIGGLRVTGLDVATGASETRFEVSEPNREVIRRARFDVGAAEFKAYRLGNLNARRIDVNAGVGHLTLDFTGEWRADAEVAIDMGLGALELRLPEGVGVRIEKDTFLTGFDAQGLVKRGDAYYSLDYEDADVRIDIAIDAAFGSIDIVWVR